MNARDAAPRLAPSGSDRTPSAAEARSQPGQEEPQARDGAAERPAHKPRTAQATEDRAAAAREDRELVARARDGDRAAMRRLVERHQRRVYQLALGIVKDHDEALDVVQETFVKVHQHLPNFKGDAAFYTWVYRIASNIAIDALRRGRGTRVEVEENTLTDESARHETWSPASASPQTAALRGELGRQLEQALQGLSPAHRSILLLRELDGLSYEELAQTLEIPKGTVMSRLFHARQRMQQALRPYLGDERAEDEAEVASAGKHRG